MATAASARALPDEPDRLEGFSAPREVDRVVGHEAALAEFAGALRGGTLHHACLLVGPEGIGKATLAYTFARAALAGGGGGAGGDQAVFRKVAALSHPNLLLLRRSWIEKTKRYSQWIGVDEVRRLRSFLGNTAGQEGWRVIVIDRADELNQNAANALLKALEEPPPQTLFLLMAASEGRLPVTIRSRCRTLRLDALEAVPLEQAVRAALLRDGHEVDEETLRLALDLAQGSVRRALELVTGEGIALYRELLKIFNDLPELDSTRAHKLTEKLAGSGSGDRLDLFFSLLLGLLERLIRIAATGEEGTAKEREIAARLLGPANLDAWAEAWEAIGRAKAEASILNLDRSLLVLDTLFRLQRLAREAAALQAS